MGKYIWPRDVGDATYFYLSVLRELRSGASLDELFDKILHESDFGVRPSRRAVQRKLYQLSQSGLVSKKGSYGKAHYSVTSQGLERLERLSFVGYRPKIYSEWDNRWRLVMFDIPENLRDARYHIRRLLKELGFKQLQLSVWIHPLPYLDAFHSIQKAYGIESHLLLVEVVDYTPPRKLFDHFHKRYPSLNLKMS